MAQDIGIDFKAVQKAAKEELQKENVEKYTKVYKKKLKELDDAQAIVRNLQRELDNLEHELQSV